MRPFLDETPADEARALGLHVLTLPMDLTSPVRAYLSLRAAGKEACLLESADGPLGLARWSFCPVNPSGALVAQGRDCTLTFDGQVDRFEASPLEALRRGLELAGRHGDRAGLPPFAGGWVGLFSYELVRQLEPRVPAHGGGPPPTPTIDMRYFGDVVAFDHVRQRIVVICDTGDNSPPALEGARQRARALAVDVYAPPAIPGPVALEGGETTSPMGDDDYEAAVRHLQANIRVGEIFQGVPARRFERRLTGDPFTLYRALRLTNPAPHMFFFETPRGALIGSSPERLVSVQAGRVQTRPIAGTRPRGATEGDDARLAAELRRDTKERAEHDMLVDLARNDLGRVATVGTVEVVRYQEVERFSRVQHLVSVVEADLRADRDALDALAACFPAGTVSGAPKIRAMELIAEVEPTPRGAYAGAFGYVDRVGNLDTAICIRTLWATAPDDAGVRTAWAQAGAGVVHASVPASERAEVGHKARALLECIELAATSVFGPGDGEPSSASPAPGDPAQAS